MRMSNPCALTNRKPTRRCVPFFTRSRTVSREIGMRSVSRRESGAKVFEPRNRSGRNSAPNTADTVSVAVVSTLYTSMVTGPLGRCAESGLAMGTTSVAVSTETITLSVLPLEYVRGSVSNRTMARVSSVSPCDASIRNFSSPIGGNPRIVVSVTTASIVVSLSTIACCGQSSGHDRPASSFSVHAVPKTIAAHAVSNITHFLNKSISPVHRRLSECGLKAWGSSSSSDQRASRPLLVTLTTRRCGENSSST